MTTVYVTDYVSPEIYSNLRSRYTVYRGYGNDAKPWSAVAPIIDAALVRTQIITAGMIEEAPRLKIIARHGVGFDNVDVRAASEKGVWVTTTPGANAPAVAEHVFALALGVARRVVEGSRAVIAGEWSTAKPRLLGTQLQGKTIGIIGFGQIGQRVATLARGFGMSIAVVDPILVADDVADSGIRLTNLDDLLESSDVVTLHVPLTPDTQHMINAAALERLRDGAILVNTSRGGLIDEAALEAEIRKGRILAGLDVVEGESTNMNNPVPDSQISVDLPGLVITPHIAGQSDQAMIDVGNAAVECIDATLAGREPAHAVNRQAISVSATHAV